jgi:hypothetical protein
MLATAGMYAEDVSSNEFAIHGKMSRGNSDIGDSGLAEIVALKTSRRVWTVFLSHSVALAG